jgi:predicted enzyme related to lactoylglutathione lyase
MNVKSIDMTWLVVKDFKAAVDFYTKVVGLKLMESSEEWGWAELQGHEGGSRLGIAQDRSEEKIKPGSNAVPTFTVASLEAATVEMEKKGAKKVGDVMEVPGHVKMLLFKDADGNHFQMVEMLG